jgi:FkbM family methyltransferase
MNTSPETAPGHAHHEGLHGSSRLARWGRAVVYGFAPLRRLVKSKLGERIVYTLRVARLVKRPLAFIAGEMRGEGVETLVLRNSGTKVTVRRRSGDLVMLHQILGRDIYAEPAEVAARLAALGRPPRIADLGGNVGFFTMRMLERHPGAEVFAVEADPDNAEVFARTIAANGLGDRVELVHAAAATEPGSVSFAAGNYFQSRVVEGPGDGTVTVEAIDVLPVLADRDLIKIDIEGSEWPILADPRFRELTAPVVTMEWHAHGCPDEDPAAAAERALGAAGYTVHHESADPGCGTLWAWR